MASKNSSSKSSSNSDQRAASDHRHHLYLRVSSAEQSQGHSLDHQEAFLRRFLPAGVEPTISREVMSGKAVANRPKLRALLDDLRPGDHIHVAAVDRLGRNASESLAMEKKITDAGAHLLVAGQKSDEQWEMSALLMVLAESDNRRRSAATKRGLAMAKERGSQLGRKRVSGLSPEIVATARAHANPAMSRAECLRELRIGKSAFHDRVLRFWEDHGRVAGLQRLGLSEETMPAHLRRFLDEVAPSSQQADSA